MEAVEVADLYKRIKKKYPWFDASVEQVREDHKYYFSEFSYETALANVIAHILTEPQPPTIAHIRGRAKEEQESRRSKEEAESFMAKMEASRRCNIPPPMGFWEAGRARIRSEA